MELIIQDSIKDSSLTWDELWLLYLRLLATGFQQTGAHRCPHSNHKRSDTQNEREGENNHLSLIVPIVGLVVVIIRVIPGKKNAVNYNDYRSKTGGYIGETYEKGSLKKYIYK